MSGWLGRHVTGDGDVLTSCRRTHAGTSPRLAFEPSNCRPDWRSPLQSAFTRRPPSLPLPTNQSRTSGPNGLPNLYRFRARLLSPAFAPQSRPPSSVARWRAASGAEWRAGRAHAAANEMPAITCIRNIVRAVRVLLGAGRANLGCERGRAGEETWGRSGEVQDRRQWLSWAHGSRPLAAIEGWDRGRLHAAGPRVQSALGTSFNVSFI